MTPLPTAGVKLMTLSVSKRQADWNGRRRETCAEVLQGKTLWPTEMRKRPHRRALSPPVLRFVKGKDRRSRRIKK